MDFAGLLWPFGLCFVLYCRGNKSLTVDFHDRPDIYFMHNYGHCRLHSCRCIDRNNPRFGGAWGGLACPDWIPLGSQEIKDMIEKAKSSYLDSKNVTKSTINTQV